MRSTTLPLARALAAACLLFPAAPPSAAAEPDWPRRVLVTNDNGIDDVRIVELARALAGIAEVHVVAATTDRSGTSNLLSSVREGQFRVERRELGAGIQAWALEGYPADCVLFALTGPMREHPPDLVISGLNGGPNLGDDWFGSGTIGAARAAAYFGIPAVAISGVDDDDPVAVEGAVRWVVDLVSSRALARLRPPQYLTVSLPPTPPTGVEVVTRARGLYSGAARPAGEAAQNGLHTWRLDLEFHPEAAPAESDVAVHGRGAIAVVPMGVDEYDPELAALLREDPGLFPAWTPAKPASGVSSGCTSGFGAYIDDAEDASGREWGVIIEEVFPGGKAEEVGLRAGDVIVRMNGIDLEVSRRSREDPDDRFVRLLRELGCGDVVVLDYLRGGEPDQVRFRVPENPRP